MSKLYLLALLLTIIDVCGILFSIHHIVECINVEVNLDYPPAFPKISPGGSGASNLAMVLYNSDQDTCNNPFLDFLAPTQTINSVSFLLLNKIKPLNKLKSLSITQNCENHPISGLPICGYANHTLYTIPTLGASAYYLTDTTLTTMYLAFSVARSGSITYYYGGGCTYPSYNATYKRTTINVDPILVPPDDVNVRFIFSNSL